MKKMISVVFVLALFGAGCAPDPIPVVQAPTKAPIDKPPAVPLPTPIGVEEGMYPEDPNPVRPRPAGTVCDLKNFICMEASLVGAKLGTQVRAKGTGIAFENTINWMIEDKNGKELAKGFVTAESPDIGQPGPFEIVHTLQNPPAEGFLNVFEYSANDGSVQHLVKIPVKF
jgi:hypothetical protein